MGNINIALVTASLGGFDIIDPPMEQSIPFDYHSFTDENFPPRINSMTPRLQAKIPKCFAWQLAPGYEYYMWLDGNMIFSDTDALKYFYDNCQGYDIVTLRHPGRNTVKWESRYVQRGIEQGSRYVYGRYANELLEEQMGEIQSDPDFVDDMLVNGGIFMYRNTPDVQKMLKEWWYHVSRYLIMDQCSFSYVLKKSGLKINVRPDVYNDCTYLKHRGHVRHY